ncbi:hypothetical protein BDW22DRAFT_1326331 [Trametopsis cervina]|nr:hypothetical protein BDW22DRAFT_1326331 [Trametopsis cervina]
MASKPSPLPLSETLRDLALLRSCDIDLSALVPQQTSSLTTRTEEGRAVEVVVTQSYEFVQNARTALKMLNQNKAEKQGARVEDIRSALDDVSRGLGSTSS